MRAVAGLLVLVLAVGLVPETEGFWGLITGLVGAVTNLFGKRRRRGLEDIIGMSKEDKEKACQKLGTPGPLTKELIREVFNKVDASKSSGSVGDDELNHDEISIFIGCLEVLDYCETKNKQSA